MHPGLIIIIHAMYLDVYISINTRFNSTTSLHYSCFILTGSPTAPERPGTPGLPSNPGKP